MHRIVAISCKVMRATWCVCAGLKGSTALSQAVVTGGALAGFMYSSCKRHPDDHEQSLVDFDLALILTPMLLLGITAGALRHVICSRQI